MKIPTRMQEIAVSSRAARVCRRGFALVVTLFLMILLTVLAVGLLGLSVIALRTGSEAEAMAAARANARLALMLALGDLQQSLGPDKAATATSEILQSPGKSGLTGVWSSWDYDPSSGSLDYNGPKTQTATDSNSTGFRRWLVSSPDPAAVTLRDFGNSEWSGDTVTLADKATFGGDLPGGRPIVAGKVPLTKDGKVQGAYAWHVTDESVKARINIYRDPREQPTLAQQSALLASHRPDVAVMDSALNFLPKDATRQEYTQAKEGALKITSLGQIDLIGGRNTIRKFRNDVTPYSLGVLADVRKGGLKRDLSSVFEMSASPQEYLNKGLYLSTHGITGPSDPRWSRLASYYNIFKSISTPDTKPTFNQPPTEEILMPAIGSPPSQPSSFFPGPVIAKVQVLFTLVTRPNHGGGPDGDLTRPLLLHLMYTPIVTLHNPYNVSITFDMLEVEFQSIPIGMRFTAGTQDSGRMLPFNELYDRGRTGGFIAKAIVLKISNWRDYDQTRPGSSNEALLQQLADAESLEPHDPIVMLPGQTLICCPYLDPTDYLRNDSCTFFDYGNTLTRSIKTKPGFFGNTIGFTLDWLGPDGGGKKMSMPRDNISNTPISVTAGAVKPTYGGDAAFEVTSSITVNGTKRKYSGIRVAYPELSDLQKVVKDMTFTCMAADAFVRNFVVDPDIDAQINKHANAKPFALFSAYARTTSGGVNVNNVRSINSVLGNELLNGRFAGKPFLFNNPATPISMANLQNSKLGALSYELSLEPVNIGSVNRILQSDATNRTPYLTGNTTNQGTKSGSYLEVPVGPMQTIADFRRSNALASPFAPSFVQPVGNSTASPLITTSRVSEPGPDGYDLLDHSVLANHALYDGFYFSTFATDGTKTPGDTFNAFMDGTRPLAAQTFQPYLPEGTTAQQAATTLFATGRPKNDAYQNAARYQMVQGPFNVNSTSVNAWKAKLASMRGCSVPIIKLLDGTKTQQAAANNPIFPMSLMNSTASDLSQDLVTPTGRENRWNGFRQLTDAELDTLAKRIVDEVKTRGPFLSMSEFVNRRVGSNSQLTQRGALEAAIEAAGVNNTTFTNQVPIQANDVADAAIYGFRTPQVVTGNPAAGAPGWISQGDLMRILEPAATVRADTFVIRVCGEAKNGVKLVRAYAEAVCQRIPEDVNPASAATSGGGSGTAATNNKFGRRIKLVSFRWLSPREI